MGWTAGKLAGDDGGDWGTLSELTMGAGKTRDRWDRYRQDCDISLLLLNACIVCGRWINGPRPQFNLLLFEGSRQTIGF